MNIISLIEQYEELRQQKLDLEDELKDVKASLAETEQDMVKAMVEADIDFQPYKGYQYAPEAKVHYSFKAQDTLAAMGVDKIEVMRDNGFDFLIQETINQRSMESAFKEYLEQNEALPKDVAEIISSYEELKIGRRKVAAKGLSKVKKVLKED